MSDIVDDSIKEIQDEPYVHKVKEFTCWFCGQVLNTVDDIINHKCPGEQRKIKKAGEQISLT